MEINLLYEIRENGKVIGSFSDYDGMKDLFEFIRENCEDKSIEITTFFKMNGEYGEDAKIEAGWTSLDNVKFQYED